MRKLFYLFVSTIWVVSVLFSGCKSQDEKDLSEVANLQIQALNSENVKQYMSTFDSAADFYKETEVQAKDFFKTYNLKYELEDFKVVLCEQDKAEILLTITTKRISGPRFQNNRTITFHKLHKKNGKWLFYESMIRNLTAIE